MFKYIVVFASCFLINFELLVSTARELDWWQTEVIYQIYPKSFKDSDGDGVGDLKGIEEKVDHFKETGIGAIWLTPIFSSPMVDNGYDVSNFFEIDESLGTMDDFESLLRKLKSMNIKLILDFVPNHSSNESEWFTKSVRRIDPYTDFYVWKDPKGWSNNGTEPIPPNNWISVLEGPAWKYVPERKQFYLHNFFVQQPDLNFRSKFLTQELKSALRFWLDKGVDGFRMDAVNYLVEHADFPDEPVKSARNGGPIQTEMTFSSLIHMYTQDQPETYDVLTEWRRLFDSYKQKDGHTRLILTEAYTSLPNTVRYYGNSTTPIAHIPFNFLFLRNLNYSSNAKEVESKINDWMEAMPQDKWANWVLGNHDNHRMADRFSPQMIDGLNMLLLLLPGTAICYQGDELGMSDTKIRWDQTDDNYAKKFGIEEFQSVTRDPQRTPFQWNSNLHAGFSSTTNSTWLPVNPNFYALNLEAQKKDERSHWKIFRNLVNLRKSGAFQNGTFKTYSITDWVFTFERNIPGEEINVVVINFNNIEENVNLKRKLSDLPSKLNVIVASVNSEYNVGDTLTTGKSINSKKNVKDTAGFKMRPNSALVLRAIIKKEQPPINEKYEYHSSASLTDRSITSFLLWTIFFKYIVNLL